MRLRLAVLILLSGCYPWILQEVHDDNRRTCYRDEDGDTFGQ